MPAEDDRQIGVKLGAGREADVHARGDGTVVKLYRLCHGDYHPGAHE